MGVAVPPHVEQAAHALRLDVVAAEVVAALEAQKVEVMLLKGPATAHWLYASAPHPRPYSDVDLLVSNESFPRVEDLLRGLGFASQAGEFHLGETTWAQESTWVRGGSFPTEVDLHRGFHGVAHWPSWWAVMNRHSDVLDVAGRPVRIPDAPGCALIVTLNDTAVGRDAKSSADLGLALATFGDDVWREATRRAEAVGALPSFALGLASHEAGRELARRLRLSPALTPEAATRGLTRSGFDPLQVGRAWMLIHRLGGVAGWRQRVRVLFDVAFPSPEFLRATRPLARHGPLGLAAALLARALVLATRTPEVLLMVYRGRRRARRSG